VLFVKYKHLIIVLFIVATASWLWAEPSLQVMAPTRQPTLEPEPVDSEGRISWTDYQRDEFGLAVSVEPGKTFDDSVFEVAFHGPEGFDLARDGGGQVRFFLESKESSLCTGKLTKVGPNRWRFRGSELEGFVGEKAAVERLMTGETTLSVSTFLVDERQGRFSRGANIMTVQSEPVQFRQT
jgi:hypothetical protein